MTVVRVAAVQAAPVFLDLDATVERALDLIEQAADAGAELVCFPETFLPAYPDWVWRTTPWSRAATDLQHRLFENAVDVPGPVTALIGEAAARHRVHLVMGLNERDGGTLYNSTAYFGPDGRLLGKHRKLVPTGGERLVWGMGDGSTLDVFDTAIGRLGGLICWENYMPLARAALYEQRVDLYVAPTWDNSDVWVPTLQHIAKEGRCFVIGVNFCLKSGDLPDTVPHKQDLYDGDDDWMARGNSAIVDPYGEILAGPLIGEPGIVTADLDLTLIPKARAQFDAVGHYARPDVFRLRVD